MAQANARTYPEALSNDLSLEERETHIGMTAAERSAGLCVLYTDDPIIYAQMLRKGYVPDDWEDDNSHAKFTIEWRLITVRRNAPKKTMTREQRVALEEGMQESKASDEA